MSIKETLKKTYEYLKYLLHEIDDIETEHGLGDKLSARLYEEINTIEKVLKDGHQTSK